MGKNHPNKAPTAGGRIPETIVNVAWLCSDQLSRKPTYVVNYQIKTVSHFGDSEERRKIRTEAKFARKDTIRSGIVLKKHTTKR